MAVGVQGETWGWPQSLARTDPKTAAYQIAAGELVPVDTTSGSVTVTLPLTPADRTQVAVKHVTQGGSNTVTIACAGNDVFNKTGGSTTGSLTLVNQAMLLQYDAAGIWTVLADDLPLSDLDLRYQGIGTYVAVVGGHGTPSFYYDAHNSAPNMLLGTGIPSAIDATAHSNVAFGNGAIVSQPQTGNLSSVTTGYDNCAFGAGALPSLTTGHSNVAMGADSATKLTTGFSVVAIGAQAVENNLTASDLTGVGAGALQNATAGPNTGIGSAALNGLTTGTSCTAIGYRAGWLATTATNLTAVGEGAGQQNLTGADITAIGYHALQNATAGPNTAVGSLALVSITTGTQNVGVGGHAGETATTATELTAVGYQALQRPTGSDNTAVGALALRGAGAGSTASESTAIGYSTLTAVSSGVENTGVGSQVLTAVTTGGGNCGVGTYAGLGTVTTGSRNTFIGYKAGYTDGTTATTNNNDMTLIGAQAQATTGDVIVLGKAIATRPNLIFGGVGATAAFGGGVGVFAIANAVTVPGSNPTGGGVLYVEAGALKWRGSGGTVTVLGAA